MNIKVEDIEFVSSSGFLPDCVVACVVCDGRLLYLVLDPEDFSVDMGGNSGVFFGDDELNALSLAISKYANDNDIEPLLSCSVLDELVDELSERTGERYVLYEMFGGGFELRHKRNGDFWHVASYHSSSYAYSGLKEMLNSLK